MKAGHDHVTLPQCQAVQSSLNPSGVCLHIVGKLVLQTNQNPPQTPLCIFMQPEGEPQPKKAPNGCKGTGSFITDSR